MGCCAAPMLVKLNQRRRAQGEVAIQGPSSRNGMYGIRRAQSLIAFAGNLPQRSLLYRYLSMEVQSAITQRCPANAANRRARVMMKQRGHSTLL